MRDTKQATQETGLLRGQRDACFDVSAQGEEQRAGAGVRPLHTWWGCCRLPHLRVPCAALWQQAKLAGVLTPCARCASRCVHVRRRARLAVPTHYCCIVSEASVLPPADSASTENPPASVRDGPCPKCPAAQSWCGRSRCSCTRCPAHTCTHVCAQRTHKQQAAESGAVGQLLSVPVTRAHGTCVGCVWGRLQHTAQRLPAAQTALSCCCCWRFV